jgi:hypothetical protein
MCSERKLCLTVENLFNTGRDSSGNIVTRPRLGIHRSILYRDKFFSSLRRRNRLWDLPASYPIDAGTFSPGVKRPGREAITRTLTCIFMAWYLIKLRDNFILPLLIESFMFFSVTRSSSRNTRTLWSVMFKSSWNSLPLLLKIYVIGILRCIWSFLFMCWYQLCWWRWRNYLQPWAGRLDDGRGLDSRNTGATSMPSSAQRSYVSITFVQEGNIGG